jgi:hypothetical protein
MRPKSRVSSDTLNPRVASTRRIGRRRRVASVTDARASVVCASLVDATHIRLTHIAMPIVRLCVASVAALAFVPRDDSLAHRIPAKSGRVWEGGHLERVDAHAGWSVAMVEAGAVREITLNPG